MGANNIAQSSRTGEAGWGEAGWLLLLVLIPVSFDRFAAFPFDWHKAALLRSVVAIVFIIWLIQHWKKPVILTGSRVLYAALFFYLLSDALSTLFSLAPSLSLTGSLHRGGGLLSSLAFIGLFFVAGQGLQSGPARDRLVTALLAVSLPVSLYAMMQHAGVDSLFWDGNVGYRATSTIGNPIFLSAFLNYAFIIGLARLLQFFDGQPVTETHRSAPLLLALLLVQLWAIWVSQSRGPVLALGVGLVALALATKPLSRLSVKRVIVGVSQAVLMLVLSMSAALTLLLLTETHWLAAILCSGLTTLLMVPVLRYRLTILLPSSMLLAALILIFSFAFQVRVEPVGVDHNVENQVHDIIRPLQRTLSRERSARERIQYWLGYRDAFLRTEPLRLLQPDQAVSLSRDQRHGLRPWLGYGPEMAGDVVSQSFPLKLASRYPINTKIDRAHNSVWDRLLNQGMLGLITWLAFMAVLIDTAIKRLGRQPGPLVRWSSWTLSAVGTIAASWFLGSEFLGLCLQLGLVAAALLQLLLSPAKRQSHWTSAVAFAAILMHLSETSVGISITSTEILFWLCAALVVATPAKPGHSEHFSAAGTGGLLAVIVGGLAFSFLGAEAMPRIDDAGLLMVSTPVNSGLAGWLASITGTTWQTGSAAGLIALYAGIFGLGSISMALLLNPRIFANNQELLLMLKKFWPLIGLAALIIWIWQWLLGATPVPLSWRDESALIKAAARHADAMVLHAPLFYLWVIASLFWLAHCLNPLKNTSVRSLQISHKTIAAVCGIILVYVLGVRPSMASLYAHSAKRWGGGDLQTWLAVTGKTRESVYKIALDAMQRAVTLRPGQPEYRTASAEMSTMAGRSSTDNCEVPSPANMALFEAMRLHPADVTVLRGLVLLANHRMLTVTGDEQRKIWANCTFEYYKLLTEFNPGHPQAHAESGRFALDSLENPALADTLSTTALSLHDETMSAIEIKIELARRHQQQSCRAEQAACERDRSVFTDWLNRALVIDPKQLEIRLLLVDQYLLAKQYAMVRSSLFEGMLKHPGNTAMLASLLRASMLTGDHELPLAVVEAVIAQLPTNAALLLVRIELLVKNERHDEARAALQTMLDADLLAGRSATQAARLFIRLDDIAKANEVYHIALRKTPGDAAIWLEAARFSIAIDDRPSADLLLDNAAARSGNRLQAIEIEGLRLSNFQAQSDQVNSMISERRLQALHEGFE